MPLIQTDRPAGWLIKPLFLTKVMDLMLLLYYDMVLDVSAVMFL